MGGERPFDWLIRLGRVGLTVLAFGSALGWPFAWCVPSAVAQDRVDNRVQNRTSSGRVQNQTDNRAQNGQSPSRRQGATPSQSTGSNVSTGRQVLNELGFANAAARREGALPRGAGIIIGHVEGSEQEYGPDITNPAFRGVMFQRSVAAARSSGHANTVGRIWYGSFGVASGVTEVHLYPASTWMGGDVLRAGTPVPPRLDSPVQIFNHSWIADPPEAASLQVLARTDYLIDRAGAHVVCGVNNGANKPMAYVMASAYNALAVGTWSGNGASSGGFTRIDTPGRCKPDLVGPRGLTSWTTPMVSGVLACLLEHAATLGDRSAAAARPETMRAILMAGASKPPAWAPAPERPLDEHLGAGVVRFDRSLDILEGGVGPVLENPLPEPAEENVFAGAAANPVNDEPHGALSSDIQTAEPLASATGSGWTHGLIQRGERQVIELELATNALVSVSLNWNRRVFGAMVRSAEAPGRVFWIPRPAMPNLDLMVYRREADGSFRPWSHSDSPIDNVEHVYGTWPAGQYRLEVLYRDAELLRQTGDGLPEVRDSMDWTYAMAWWVGSRPAAQADQADNASTPAEGQAPGEPTDLPNG